jgi:hypothetical protein
MSYTITITDPVTANQSKYRDEHGILRYSADNSEVFPHPTGVRTKGAYQEAADDLQAARDIAVDFVHDRMNAFGDDREALARYGFTDAEELALDMTDNGLFIKLSDGWEIRVENDQR